MTAPDHLRITGPEDILGFIPHSLGYWPARSLVAMTMQGKRLGATLRVDLPGTAGGPGGSGAAAVPAGYARSVASYLEADDKADGSLLALFTETDADPAPWASFLAELESALADAGMPVRDAWLIGADYWRNAYCLDPSCCAPPGRPVEEIRNSRLNAEMVFRGSTVGAAPGAARIGPRSTPDPAVTEAQGNWAAQFSVRTRDRGQFHQVLDVWSRVLQAPAPGPVLTPALTGYLRASLCVLPWRDAVLVMTAAGRESAERGAEDFGVLSGAAQRCGSGGSRRGSPPAVRPPAALPPLEGFPPPGRSGGRKGHPGSGGGSGAKPSAGAPRGGSKIAGSGTREGGGKSKDARGMNRSGLTPQDVAGYGEVLLGLAPPVPDWSRLAGLERVLVQLGEAGGEAGAAALTGRGWIEWCRGKGSFAHDLFSQAEAECPGYRLAELLEELVRRGNLCGWARRSETAWQRFDPDVA